MSSVDLFPTTQTGSYPRPRWNGFDLGGEDIRVALRRADFAEAYTDGVRAMIGDQVGVGLDVPTDGHLWYDRHEGLISSFLLYPAYHLDGIEVWPEPNPLIAAQGAAAIGGLRRHLEQRRRDRPGRTRHHAPGRAVAGGQ